MSTYFRPAKPMPLEKIKKSNYIIENQIEVIQNEERQCFRCLDGHYLHFDLDDKGNVIHMQRYGNNHPVRILQALQLEFDGMRIFSEYDEEYQKLLDAEIEKDDQIESDISHINVALDFMQMDEDDNLIELSKKEKNIIFWILHEMHSMKREILEKLDEIDSQTKEANCCYQDPSDFH